MIILNNTKVYTDFMSEETMDAFIDIMNQDKPLFFNRLGGTDYEIACAYYNNKNLINNSDWCVNALKQLNELSGYFDFSNSVDKLQEYLELLITYYKGSDHVSYANENLINKINANKFNCDDKNFLEYLLEDKTAITYSLIEQVQPFLKTMRIWGNNKKILIISPFSKSIEYQWKNKNELYIENAIKFPEFELKTYKTKITYNVVGDTKESLRITTNNWLEESERMASEISTIDFDIAFLSCATYSNYLGYHIKSVMKKKAIYIGGILNVLFNIYGERYCEEFYKTCGLNPESQIDAFENDEIWHIRGGRSLKGEALNAYFGKRKVVATPDHAIPILFPLGHYYSPVADPVDIAARADQIWNKVDTMKCIDLNVEKQLELLEQLKPYTADIDYPVEHNGDDTSYFYQNDHYPALDADFLYAALCHFKPKTFIEVGCGFSSLITADVNRRLFKNNMEFNCIEPYPRQFLIDGIEGITQLIVQKAQDVDLAFFDRLNEGDILFIDSSHVSKVGGDVNFLFFEVIPNLKKGVMVHIHDIFLPDEYHKEWVIDQGRNWNEQYLVRAFLQYNSDWEVMWASHFMATRHPRKTQETFHHGLNGGSLWLRRV